jgi:threonylcarbamoyladenosine tRNA methylthiotransferase MtaB
MKTFSIKTLGCKVNQYESQAIRDKFIRCGWEEAKADSGANLCLINTCTVTLAADRKSRNAIRHSRKIHPKAKIVVTGCLLKLDSNDLKEKVEGIDYLIPKSFFADGVDNFKNQTRAFIKIQDGCDNNCSFCKVPLARGKSRSRDIEDIKTECKRLVILGFKEIVLTGICLGSYGQDLKPGLNLAQLIRALEEIKDLKRIRLSSIEAGFVDKDLIEILANSTKLCPHLHIPFQSGDDKVLKDMNRKYNSQFYLDLVNRLRNRISEIAITTDIIVGFPTEDNASFDNTLEFLGRVKPSRIHIFKYSRRDKTQAASLKSSLNIGQIKEREARLRKLALELSFSFHNRFKNKRLQILVEERCNGLLFGHSPHYIETYFLGSDALKNRIVDVKIEQVESSCVRGNVT